MSKYSEMVALLEYVNKQKQPQPSVMAGIPRMGQNAPGSMAHMGGQGAGQRAPASHPGMAARTQQSGAQFAQAPDSRGSMSPGKNGLMTPNWDEKPQMASKSELKDPWAKGGTGSGLKKCGMQLLQKMVG